MQIRTIYCILLGLIFNPALIAQHSESEAALLAPSLNLARSLDYSLEFNVQGLVSTREKLPFWMYHNSRGRISPNTNATAFLAGKMATFISSKSSIIYGAGLLYREGVSNSFLTDELYAHYQNPFLYITAGRKQRLELYNGLSATNENILWSLNARPLPGIQIGTPGPLFIFSDRGPGFEASFNEYWMGDDAYTENLKLHHKKLRLVYRGSDWQIKVGVQHFAQWGGISGTSGKQPTAFKDYLHVLAGHAGTVTDERGKLSLRGNHLGSYELYFSKNFRDFQLHFIYNHIFEDMSGRRLANLPDGRYGIFFKSSPADRLINAVMYELYYTQHQSYTAEGFHKHDNYFNNNTYRGGWMYNDFVLGAPFFTPDPSGRGIINNKFTAHHVGIGGQMGNHFHTFPYKVLLSYAHNEGRYNQRFHPAQDTFYGLLDVQLLRRHVDVNFQAGVELDSYTAPVYGIGLQLKYHF